MTETHPATEYASVFYMEFCLASLQNVVAALKVDFVMVRGAFRD